MSQGGKRIDWDKPIQIEDHHVLPCKSYNLDGVRVVTYTDVDGETVVQRVDDFGYAWRGSYDGSIQERPFIENVPEPKLDYIVVLQAEDNWLVNTLHDKTVFYSAHEAQTYVNKLNIKAVIVKVK